MSSPPKTMVPVVGRRKPDKRLKHVVLPAPFGPMRPTISPSSTVRPTWLTAASPPKCFVRLRVSRRGIRARRAPPESRQLPGQHDETARQEQDGRQHDDGKEDRLVRTATDRLGDPRQERGPHHRPPAHPPAPPGALHHALSR